MSLRNHFTYIIDESMRAIDNIGGQLDAAYGLLLNLLPNLPANAERRPSKQRKARRGKRASA